MQLRESTAKIYKDPLTGMFRLTIVDEIASSDPKEKSIPREEEADNGQIRS